MNGWIKIHRQIMESAVYQDTNAKLVLLHLLLSADRKGYCRVSRFRTSAELHLKPSTFRNVLQRLHKDYEIVTLKRTRNWTDVYINKWSEYQQTEGQPKGHQKDSRRTSKGHLYKKEERRIENINIQQADEKKETVKAQYEKLIGKPFPKQTKTTDWQLLAIDYSSKLGVKPNASWFKAFKDNPYPKLQKAYSVTVDANAGNPELYFYKVLHGSN